MQATRIVKMVEQTQLSELTPYLGQKVEIIIFPIEEMEQSRTQTVTALFEIIDECAGQIVPWTREELYDRNVFS